MHPVDILAIKEKLLLNEFKLTFYSLILYFLSFLSIIYYASDRKKTKKFASGFLLFTGIFCHLSVIILRWTVANRYPFQTLYESLLWFGFVTVIVYFYYFLKKEEGWIGGMVVLPVTFSALFYAFFFLNPVPEPLSPALNSGWFFYHAITAFGSYAVFVNNFAGEVGRVFLNNEGSKASIRHFSFRIVLLGFILLTFAIVSGAVWAEEAWGRYWSWDPKETWALLTWTVYAVYIHYSRKTLFMGKYIFLFSLLGFISMVMTFLGVSWLAKLLGIPSLHAYAL